MGTSLKPRMPELVDGPPGSEQECSDYLFRLRWPRGFRCPRCGAAEHWRTGRGLLRCRRCDAQTSVTAGTVFHGSHKPLRAWFAAMHHVLQSPPGASARQIQRLLDLKSYHTAWEWLDKLRHVMVRPHQDRLHGVVHVDEVFVGGKQAIRRPLGGKAILLMIAVTRRRSRPGLIRITRLRDSSSQSLLTAIRDMVDPSSIVRTDRCPAYTPGIELMGYRHQPFRLYPGAIGVAPLPLVAEVAAQLSTWLQKILHGAVRPSQLDYYLAEFTFRFNHRAWRSPGKALERLLLQALETPPEGDGSSPR